MNVGMLWLDDDRSRSLEEKVSRAVEYYQEKYGRFPDTCLVNTTMLKDETKVGKVNVQPIANILPHHFWLGMNAS
ncbi:MAG: hypothetical protein H6657_18900 [Ardenticatenaceae bacterium]|nr:hypothetical protein [Anaerolineales bacterium]MCB8979483.1 hypothetical protein [Ardenticatenaceae bacterium]